MQFYHNILNFLTPIIGEWGEWIKVTDCSYNCGGGHYIRARNCEYETDDPEAFGKSCEDRAIVYADCNIMSCPKSGMALWDIEQINKQRLMGGEGYYK